MRARPALLALVLILCAWGSLFAGTPKAGFQETAAESSIFMLSGFDWAPNGDMWIISKNGNVQVRRAGSPGRTFVLHISVDPNGERGLIGLAVDPNFADNQFIYFYYTVRESPAYNRVSRFRSVGDSLEDETVLLEGPDLISVEHNAGDIRFGLDGMLYIGMGDNRRPAMAGQLDNLLGKILRIAPDGSIPSSNPFAGDPNARPEVWAYGLRNPYRFSVQPDTGTLFIGDVGEATWEELNLGIPGANYGHPLTEGPDPPGVAGVTYPVFSYNHNGTGAAIIPGGHMVAGQFPAEYEGDFFYADFSLGKVYRLMMDGSSQPAGSEEFVTGVPFPVHLRVGPDGALYYASINFQTIYRVAYVGGVNRQPTAVATATPDNGLTPLTVQFDGSASSDPDLTPLSYSWDFGDGATSTATSPQHDYLSPGVFTSTLTVSDGQLDSSASCRIVAGNRAPVAAITSPADGSYFNAGDTISFAGQASDPEDGPLDAAAFSWTVNFHHNVHAHPYLGPSSGMTAGTFVTSVTGETATDVYYQIKLTVTDSGSPLGAAAALSDTRTVNIYPNLSTMSFATAPRPDLALTLDGRPLAPPVNVEGVVGVQRTIEALSPQQPGDGHTYVFSSWSDGGARLHTIATPAANTTFTATYGCDLLGEVADLEVNLGAGGDIVLSWTLPTDPCLSSGPGTFVAYASSTAVPATSPGDFPIDPPFAIAGTTNDTSLTIAPSPQTQFYLVLGKGSDGGNGPVGHYGR